LFTDQISLLRDGTHLLDGCKTRGRSQSRVLFARIEINIALTADVVAVEIASVVTNPHSTCSIKLREHVDHGG
jgi:hypothetical protein